MKKVKEVSRLWLTRTAKKRIAARFLTLRTVRISGAGQSRGGMCSEEPKGTIRHRRPHTSF